MTFTFSVPTDSTMIERNETKFGVAKEKSKRNKDF